MKQHLLKKIRLLAIGTVLIIITGGCAQEADKPMEAPQVAF
jgi:hypothetical protein